MILPVCYLQSFLAINFPLNIFNEGGTFMLFILLCLLLSLFFIARGFIKVKSDINISRKMLLLAVDISLLGMVIGFFASFLGLVTAFDSIESLENVDSAIFAGGLKVSLLTAIFGLLTFIIPRIGIVILRGMQREQ